MAVKESKPFVSVPVVIVLLLLAGAATGAILWAKYGRVEGGPAPLTTEAKAYTRNLKLGEVEMKATASYLGQEVVEILGKITNGGGRDVRQVDLTCVFYDPYGQVVRRARVPIVKSTLAPGSTRSFRLPFDDIPPSWNKALPQLVIAQIVF
ncbi:MAG: FxLYD domain-containing protein [Bryobacteraceae bacterium]